MKRSLLFLIVALLSLSQVALAQDNVTLTIWVWDINKPIVEASIASFQEANPDVEVVVEDLGNQNVYDRGLAGCAAGGLDLPDIYLIENSEAPVFWAQFPDCFADLRQYGAEDLRSSFPEFKWTELMVGDVVYALPFDMGPTAIFYRRDMWEEAGLNPDEILTWDDFIEAGKTLQEKFGEDRKIATVAKGGDDEWFRMLANQAGCFYFDLTGAEVTVNQPGCVTALETLGKLWDAGVLLNGGWNEQLQAISNNDVAAAFFGSWYAGVIQSNSPEQSGLWGVFPTPALTPDGVRASNIGGSAFAIPASSANQELAYAFLVNLLTNQEVAEGTLLDYGLSVSLLSVSDGEAVQEPVEFFGGQAIWEVIYSNAKDVPPANGTQYFQEARQIITITTDSYLNGDFESAQAALDDAANQISSITGLPIAAQ
jgi:lactose/L-arabinose transport system substrate-binding protein